MTVFVFTGSAFTSQSLLEMVQAMAKNVGLEIPLQVVGSADRTWVEALDFANRQGEELARRVDWGGLVASSSFTGTGSDDTFELPSSFARLPRGVAVTSSGAPVRPLTRAEWTGLTAAEGTPRYFLLENRKMRFYPYPASAATVSFTYIHDQWATGGAQFLADTDETVFPSELFIMGLIVRWRRQKGMDYADYEAEYEAALAHYAAFDDRSRLQ